MSTLVVALNPSVDVEWRVEDVQWEEKNVLQSERRWPGGKGVNVARWLRHLGGKSTLLLPLGGDTGREMRNGLRADDARLLVIPIAEATRANVIVTTAAGRQLRFNPPGPKISAGEWRIILDRFTAALPKHDLVVLSGSLPRGVPVTAYKQLLTATRAAGKKALLDCDGAPFAAAVGAKPFLVKPNEHELAQWAGRKLTSDAAVLAAARKLAGVTGGWVLLSRGAQGAVLMDGTQPILQVAARGVKVRNTVGAGDAMLAAVGMQLARGMAPVDWLRWGVAVGSAAVQMEAGRLPALRTIRAMLAGEKTL